MDVGVLGPLTVRIDGRDIVLDRPKERALLAALVLERGRPLRRERLVDALWGDQPPRSPAEALRAHVRRVRAAVGYDAIETTPSGYACARRATVDADRFREEVLCPGDVVSRAEALGSALGLWRGRPYDDLGDWDEITPARRGLEELHAQALEEWAGARLERGEAASLVSFLEQLVLEEPLHERRWELLMRALYNAGRPADALRAFQRARHSLAEEGGLEPGRMLVELDRAIATNDLAVVRSNALRTPECSSIADVVRRATESRRAGRADEAEVAFDEAERLARASSDPAGLAEVAVARSSDGAMSGLNPGTRVLLLLDEAIERLPDAPTSLRSRLLARLAVAASSNRDPALVKALAVESLNTARIVGDRPTLLSALYAKLVTETDPANIEECVGLAREMLDVADACADVSGRVLAISTMARLCARSGRVDEAAQLAAQAAELASDRADDVVFATLWYPMFRATLDGDLKSALGVADTVGEVAGRAKTDPDAARAMVYGIKALVRSVFADDAPRARVLQVRLDTISWPQANLLHLARAGMALDLARQGERAAAAEMLVPVNAAVLSNLERDLFWPGVVWAVSAVTHRLGDRERAEALYLGLVPFSRCLLVDPAGAFLGCTDHHLGLLARTSGRPEDARLHFADATDQYNRFGASWWADQVRRAG